MIIDAHFHAWRLARGDYGWLTPALGRLCRDVEVGDWEVEARPCGVNGGVLVQAAPTEAETHFLLGLAQAHESVLGVVGWVDLLAANAPARIERLAAQTKLKGLRPMLQDIADPDWILQPTLEPALQAMVEHGLAFDALIKPVHLPRVLTLCQRHPDLRVVVDHAAKPDIAGGHWQPWADGLARLAAETQAWCKLSGLLTEAGAQPRANAARRWAAHALSCFGPSRVLWGSDWPVLELAGDYASWWQESQAVLAPLAQGERAAVCGDNAVLAYRLGLPRER